ncbi:hypothetical protein Bca52824_020783 [Brassica carinata]|uniref:Uncharacterized protein n=1 Tax=Brassica carinata TaxID=52824 RepID=A0A8X7VU51_BRACI|nr:hypothetical protein Bca52824_020783 [Brassica carinata]
MNSSLYPVDMFSGQSFGDSMLSRISLVDDYWHHWTDVFAGAIIEYLWLLSLTSTFSLTHKTTMNVGREGWSSHDDDTLTRSGSRGMLDEDVEPGSTYLLHDRNRESTDSEF